MGFGETIREFGVKVNLAFDSKAFEKAEDRVNKFGDKLKGFALGVAGLSAALFESQNLFTSHARALQDEANLLGISTDKLQEYQYAAKVAANVTEDELNGSLQTLGDTMDKARARDPAAIQALVDIGNYSGKSGLILDRLNDSTYKVTDAFNDLSIGMEKTYKKSPLAASRLTQQIVGNEKLVNILKLGPKAIGDLTKEADKNYVINKKMIDAGAAMDRQMSRLWLQFRKIGYEIGFNVMKHLAPMIKEFQKWFNQNKQLIESGINEFLDDLAIVLKAVWNGAINLAKEFGPVVKQLGGMKEVVDDIVAAWLTYKALSLGVSFAQTARAVAKFIPVLLGFGAASAEAGAGATAGGAGMDVLAAGGAAADVALSPILVTVLAISAAVAGVIFLFHEFKAFMEGGFSNTLTGKGWNKLKSFASDLTGPSAGPVSKYGQVHAATLPGGAAGPLNNPDLDTNAAVTGNTFNTTNNITVPPGTSAPVAAAIISKAQADSTEKMLLNTKLSHGRNRQ